MLQILEDLHIKLWIQHCDVHINLISVNLYPHVLQSAPE